MKLTDFRTMVDERLPSPATNRRLLHIAEGITDELRGRKLDAPFEKIIVDVRPVKPREKTRRSAILDRNLEVEWRVDAAELDVPYEAFRERAFDGLAESVQRAASEIDWDPVAALGAIDAARHRTRVGLVELDWLRRRSRRDQATIHVFHEVTETDARTWLEMRSDDGLITTHEIRSEPHPIGLWASFPGYSAKLTPDAYTVSRRDGREIYRVALDELRRHRP